MSDDLERNLRDLAFTYHEAKDHLLRSLEPLIHDIVGQVLPEIAKNSLPPIVAERLDGFARLHLNQPIELAVSAQDHDAVQALLPPKTLFPLNVVKDPSMKHGQIRLRSGKLGCDIDMPALLSDIQGAVDDFFTLTTRKQAHV
ncbi:hypothetical protein [Qingshengfaniella alkalisoli]|uniref:Flagellar assembly protein FliH n=1 Tax=Qingshengfaniella alkalisoli TaxID=2599296 RepID=A0A5B8IVH5_9RHOB|nr:hypothetical protein [Qingshengfaniella alkalisoli]QDY70112.1 hypothetical protein FPZ52_11100 [Qingshengfaniella alkalisoli]